MTSSGRYANQATGLPATGRLHCNRVSAGAYGMTMASNYNTRGRAAEVMVDGDQVHLIRKREQPSDLFALESLLP